MTGPAGSKRETAALGHSRSRVPQSRGSLDRNLEGTRMRVPLPQLRPSEACPCQSVRLPCRVLAAPVFLTRAGRGRSVGNRRSSLGRGRANELLRLIGTLINHCCWFDHALSGQENPRNMAATRRQRSRIFSPMPPPQNTESANLFPVSGHFSPERDDPRTASCKEYFRRRPNFTWSILKSSPYVWCRNFGKDDGDHGPLDKRSYERV